MVYNWFWLCLVVVACSHLFTNRFYRGYNRIMHTNANTEQLNRCFVSYGSPNQTRLILDGRNESKTSNMDSAMLPLKDKPESKEPWDPLEV